MIMQPNLDLAAARGQRPAPRPVAQPHFNIVVAGEFNAGKSSVINLLLRQQVLPASVGFSEMPPTRIFASDRTGYSIVARDNERIEREDFLAGAGSGRGVRSARVELELPEFQGAAITEVSVGLDGALTPEMEEALLSADLLVWCTMAQRAWCLTEMTVVEGLPEDLMKGAILAVTRADLLRGEGQREMVQGRLEREAKQFFDQIVFLDASEKATAAAGSERAWVESGGQALFDRVIGRFRKSDKFGRDVPVAKLEDLDSRRSRAREVPEAGFRIEQSVDVRPLDAEEDGQSTLRPADIAVLWQGEVELLADWVGSVAAVEPREFLAAARNCLNDFVRGYVSPFAEAEGAEASGLDRVRRVFDAHLEAFDDIAGFGEDETVVVAAIDLLYEVADEVGSAAA